MVVESQREIEDFLETNVQYPMDGGSGVGDRHLSYCIRWSRRDCRFSDDYIYMHIYSFMRIIDNSTFGLDVAINIATERMKCAPPPAPGWAEAEPCQHCGACRATEKIPSEKLRGKIS
jgi:hypothetical protein